MEHDVDHVHKLEVIPIGPTLDSFDQHLHLTRVPQAMPFFYQDTSFLGGPAKNTGTSASPAASGSVM